MKTYNTLSDAISMAVAENGDISTWDWNVFYNEGTDAFIAPILENLKIAKKCTYEQNQYADCGISDDLTVSALNFETKPEYPDESGSYPYSSMLMGGTLLMLEDGSFISYGATSNVYGRHIYFNIDTNGIKGPNIEGRDMFSLDYVAIDNKYKLSDTSIYKEIQVNGGIGGPSARKAYESQPYEDALEAAIDGCSTTKGSSGQSCAGRLLLEGKMNY